MRAELRSLRTTSGTRRPRRLRTDDGLCPIDMLNVSRLEAHFEIRGRLSTLTRYRDFITSYIAEGHTFFQHASPMLECWSPIPTVQNSDITFSCTLIQHDSGILFCHSRHAEWCITIHRIYLATVAFGHNCVWTRTTLIGHLV